MSEQRPDTRSARRRNIAGAWGAMLSAFTIFVLNVTWERPVVDQFCEPRAEPLPELCTTVRAPVGSQWRSTAVLILIVLWMVSGAVAWRSWRRGQLVRKGPPPGYTESPSPALLSFRRRIVMLTPGLLAAMSYMFRRGADSPIAQTIGPVCSPNENGLEVCQTSTVIIQQTIVTEAGMSPLPQMFAWTLVGLTLCWWGYVVAAGSLARRFGEENLWRTAMQMRRESVPQYPAEQQRGNRY